MSAWHPEQGRIFAFILISAQRWGQEGTARPGDRSRAGKETNMRASSHPSFMAFDVTGCPTEGRQLHHQVISFSKL